MKELLTGVLLLFFSASAVSEILLPGSVVCYGGEETLKAYAVATEKEKGKMELHLCRVIKGGTEIKVLIKKKAVASENGYSIVKVRMRNNYIQEAFDDVWTFRKNISE